METNDLILGPYKEPLKKLETGFGYFGAISISKDGTKIQCHVCGELFENLSLHLRVHKIKVREYREKYGIALTTALVSESHRKSAKQRMFELNERMIAEGRFDEIRKRFQEASERSRQARMKNGTWKKDKTWLTAEHKNLRGICPDQLIALIQDASKHYGRTPSYAEFEAYHQTSRFWRPIRNTFGSWSKAISVAGLQAKKREWSKEGGRVKYSNEELLDLLSSWWLDNGSLPTFSDYKRGYLPTWETYTRRFGSMEEARRLAGITNYKVKRGGSHTPANTIPL